MYIQCMFEYILSSVVLITAKSCICEIKKHVTYELLICVVGSRINIMNKQPSFFSLRNENTFSECIFSAVTSKVISGLKKNNLNKCFVFPSRNLFILLVYLHPAHIDVQCYQVGFQLVYLIWQVRIMTGRRKKAVHKYYGRIYCHLDIGFCTKYLVSPWTIWSPVSNSRTCKLVSMK